MSQGNPDQDVVPMTPRHVGKEYPFPMLFGEFLFLKCVVNEETLLEALAVQVRSRPFLGELAVEEGFMSSWDVYRCLNEQAQWRADFGQVAIRLGILTAEELAMILELQGERSRPLGEILVEMDVLPPEELEGLLEEYNNLVASKAESHMRPTLTQGLQSDAEDPALP